ncbi:putative zinc finger protein [Orchesella cincta]|uniref:Putative zinc finger protein n=1 Tax=Orchesella cincta TaxID=48709 RepID=A0A1D2ML58_ORCCI|nr:putative zinc finger protein [Orchesella cincta]
MNQTASSSSYKSSLFGSICLLCLRTKTCTSVKSDPQQHCRSRVACIKYIVLISRYLNLNSELTKISYNSFHPAANEVDVDLERDSSHLDLSKEVNKFVLCDSCLPRAESFCKTFREFEVLRLKLEDNVAETVNMIEKSTAEEETKLLGHRRVVKRVAKPASKQVQDKQEVSPEESDDVLLSFRTRLRKSGSAGKRVNIPKVHLKRNEKADILAQRKLLKTNSEVNVNRKDDKGGEAPRVIRVICAEGTESQVDLRKLLAELPRRPSSNDDIQVVDEVSNGGGNGKISLNSTSTTASVFASCSFGRSQGTNGNIKDKLSTDNLTVERTSQACKVNCCTKVFPRNTAGSAELQNHLQYHNNLNCNICVANNFTPLSLAIHELEHSTNDQPFGFKCARCSNFSSVRSEYQEHFLNCHYNSSVELLKCPTCKKGYSDTKMQQLQLHTKKCHPDEFADKSNTHECNICHAYFKKTDALWKHLTYDHRINNRAGSFRCSLCPDAYFSSRFLDMHRMFSCSRPDKINDIAAHCANLLLLTCPICQCKLNNQYSMQLHMMTHNGEQVKFVYPNGSTEGPMIIPAYIPPVVFPSVPVEQSLQLQACAVPVSVVAPQTIQVSTSSMHMPSMATSFAPVITSVSGHQENIFTCSSQIHYQEAPAMTSETDIKPEDDISQYFFLEESDSEPLIDFGNCGDNANGPPIEDPFAWLLPDGDQCML